VYARVVLPDWLRTAKTIAGLYPRWIFRGQANAAWGLQTSLERAAVQKNLAFAVNDESAQRLTQQALDGLPNREDWILTQFQRRAHLVMNAPPAFEERLDWLAAVQHYGGPTRLLDFTHSFYIATFFAVEQACEDAAVWALWAPDIEKSNSITDDRIDQMNRQAITVAEKALRGETNDPGVLSVEPFQLNERNAIQKGLFVLPLDATKPFMENLAGTFSLDFATHNDAMHDMSVSELLGKGLSGGPHVVKFVFPRTMHDVILGDLASMNIDAATLFPGLPGYARSMYRHV